MNVTGLGGVCGGSDAGGPSQLNFSVALHRRTQRYMSINKHCTSFTLTSGRQTFGSPLSSRSSPPHRFATCQSRQPCRYCCWALLREQKVALQQSDGGRSSRLQSSPSQFRSAEEGSKEGRSRPPDLETACWSRQTTTRLAAFTTAKQRRRYRRSRTDSTPP